MIDPRKIDKKGFTLIEVMIAITVSAVVGGTLYMVFTYHQKLYKKHEIIANLQQNLRASMYLLESDIRMAGYDPLNTANPRILRANSKLFSFQMDLNANGDQFHDGNGSEIDIDTTKNRNEKITYELMDDSLGLNKLGRRIWGEVTPHPLTENIEVLDFRFFDITGQLLNPDDNDIPKSRLQDIRTLEITLISRSDREYQGQTDTRQYTNLNENEDEKMVLVDADTDENRHYFRKTLSKRIRLRNM